MNFSPAYKSNLLQVIFFLLFFHLFLFSFSQNKKVGDIQNSGPEKLSKSEQAAEITRLLKRGDSYYAEGPVSYGKALQQYLLALDMNTANPVSNFKAGKICLELNRKIEALQYLEKAYSKDNKVDEKIHYYLGYAHQRHDSIGDLDSAEAHYKTYIDEMNQKLSLSERIIKLADVNKRLAECGYERKYRQHPDSVSRDNVGNSINTSYPEYDPFFIPLTPDESILVFTSRRPSTRGGGIASVDAGYYEDIYISKKIDGVWSEAESFGDKFNAKTNNAVVGLSPDSRTMFFYRDDVQNGDIYITKRTDEGWSRPQNFQAINSIYRETSACISADGNTVYFISDRHGGSGGKDIYKCHLIDSAKNKWSPPENLGNVINTEYDEERVYLHPKEKTLYFSSKGHSSMGGYDVFKSTLIAGEWSEPENLGYPINSVDDDISYTPSGDEKQGYYSAFNPETGSKDIFFVTFLEPAKDTMEIMAAKKAELKNSEDSLRNLNDSKVAVKDSMEQMSGKTAELSGKEIDSLNSKNIVPSLSEVQKTPENTASDNKSAQDSLNLMQRKNEELSGKSSKEVLTNVEGVIIDPATNQPLSKGKVEIREKGTNNIIGTAAIDPATGQYFLPLKLLPFGKDYELVVKSGDKILQTENISVPANSGITMKKDVSVGSATAENKSAPETNKAGMTNVEGTIKDPATNKPVSNATVEIREKGTDKLLGTANVDPVTGKYILPLLPSGKDYELRVKSGDKILQTENISVPANSGTTVKKDVSVGSATAENKSAAETNKAGMTNIEGEIKDPSTNQPVSNATVEIREKGTNKLLGTANVDPVTGKYTLPLLSTGKDYELVVKSGEKIIQTENISVPAGSGATVKKDVSVGSATAENKSAAANKVGATNIQGTVKYAVINKPLTNATIEIREKGNNTTNIISVKTDAVAGKFNIPAIPTGKEYEMVIKSGDKILQVETVSIPAGSSTITIKDISVSTVTTETTNLQGIVIDPATNKAVSNATVEIREKGTNNLPGTAKVDPVTGQYTLPLLPTGKEYELVVKSGDKILQTENISVPSNSGATMKKDVSVAASTAENKSSAEANKAGTTNVEGVIKDPLTNKPVSNATVEIREKGTNKLLGTATVDPVTGKYYLPSLPTGKEYELTVKSGDKILQTENISVPAGNATSMKKDVSVGTATAENKSASETNKAGTTNVEGVVKDPSTNKPVSNATVEIREKGANQLLGTATVDPVTGKYNLPSLPTGKDYELTVKSGDKILQTENISVPAGSGTTLKKNVSVSENTSVSGVIKDPATGKPVSDGTVEIREKGTGKLLGTSKVDPATGQYFLSKVPVGKDYEVAVKSGDKIVLTENISLPANSGAKMKKDVVLKDVTTVQGAVKYEGSGKPVANAVVEIKESGTNAPAGTTKANALTGQYKLPLVATGKDYEVTIKSGDKIIHTEKISVPSGSDVVMNKDISVIMTTAIQGVIKAPASNKPVTDATVEIREKGTNKLLGTATVDPVTGKYNLSSLPTGKDYELTVKSGDKILQTENIFVPANSGTTMKKDVSVGSATAENKSAPETNKAGMTNVEGTIKDPATNKPVSNATVEIREKGTNQLLGSATVDPVTGKYNFRSLPTGKDYELTVKSGDKILQTENISVPVNSGASLKKNVSASENTSISGVIKDPATGKPLSDATVEIREKGTGKLLGTAKVDPATGQYNLSKLPVGKDYEVTVKTGDKTLLTENISIPANSGAKMKKDVLLKDVTTVQGAVKYEGSGKPVANAVVEIKESGTNAPAGTAKANALTGQYKLPLVSTGKDYEVTIKSGDKIIHTEKISVPAGSDVVMNKDISVMMTTAVQGVMKDPATNKPVTDATVEIREKGTNNILGTAKVDPVTGKYKLPSLPAGKDYELTIKSGAQILDAKDISIPANSGSKLKKDISLGASSAENKKTGNVQGVVKDPVTGKPIAATIEIRDKKTGELVATIKSDNVTGEYNLNVSTGKNYEIVVKTDDGSQHSEALVLPKGNKIVKKDILFDLSEKAAGASPPGTLLNILLFDYAKSELLPESKAYLDDLVKYMTEHPDVNVDVSGHTDSKGSAQYNLALAKRRAEAAVQYLLKKEVAKARVNLSVYGESQPIAPNSFPDGTDNPDGRKKNRRVEIKTLK